MSATARTNAVEIAGAGPAGLAAAITLARAGRRVIVHEASREVGYRFQADLQGIENWTTEQDALEVLREMGLSTAFTTLPCRAGTAFDAWGQAYPVRSQAPLFYMVERGPGPGSLDRALLEQALRLGVGVCFESRCDQARAANILGTGPQAADAIAVGYHFETDMENGFWTICDDRLAPKGYAYLLVMNGRGTVKSCMFSGFEEQWSCVERTVEAFRRLAGLRMRNPRRHGGTGTFGFLDAALAGCPSLVGERARFQDALWGFGIRIALRSGVLAARSLLEGGNYEALWRKELGPRLRASLANRAIYDALGDAGYRWALRRQAAHDARAFLRRLYRASLLKRLLLPWAGRRYPPGRRRVRRLP